MTLILVAGIVENASKDAAICRRHPPFSRRLIEKYKLVGKMIEDILPLFVERKEALIILEKARNDSVKRPALQCPAGHPLVSRDRLNCDRTAYAASRASKAR